MIDEGWKEKKNKNLLHKYRFMFSLIFALFGEILDNLTSVGLKWLFK